MHTVSKRLPRNAHVPESREGAFPQRRPPTRRHGAGYLRVDLHAPPAPLKTGKQRPGCYSLLLFAQQRRKN
jgi:hypothetical protein